MSEINWSKAPDWADKYGETGIDQLKLWLNDEQYEYLNEANKGPFRFGDAESFARDLADVRVIAERRSPWTGEGLPPVGTVCEFWGGNPDPLNPWHPALKDGMQVTVITHYENTGCLVAVFTFADARPGVNGMQVDQATEECFRPFRTPAQIAAEERNAAINEMIRHIKDHSGGRHGANHLTQLKIQEEACIDLYDAGYRLVTP